MCEPCSHLSFTAIPEKWTGADHRTTEFSFIQPSCNHAPWSQAFSVRSAWGASGRPTIPSSSAPGGPLLLELNRSARNGPEASHPPRKIERSTIPRESRSADCAASCAPPPCSFRNAVRQIYEAELDRIVKQVEAHERAVCDAGDKEFRPLWMRLKKAWAFTDILSTAVRQIMRQQEFAFCMQRSQTV